MKHAPTISRSGGFSLVELMISVVLGLLLIAGAAAAYLSSKRSYTEVEAFSTLNENARFAELIMGDALLHAGFFGEITPERLEVNPNLIPIASGDCTGGAQAYDFGQYIIGATVDGSGSALGCITDGVTGTDVLVIKRAVPRPLSDGARVNGVRDGTIDTPNAMQAGTTYIVTNNVMGMPFDGSGTAPNILAGGDVPGGVAWPYLFEAYYVRDPDPGDADDIPVLARKVLSWNGGAMDVVSEDLVEGVEDMRLRLGFDGDGDDEVDTYVDVAGIAGAANWQRVAAVEVYLLVRSTSPDPEYVDTKTYTLGGDNVVTPAANVQKYRRLLVSTQASLRNPKLVIRRSN